MAKFIGVYLFNLLVFVAVYGLGFLFFYGLSSLIIVLTGATYDAFVMATFVGLAFLAFKRANSFMNYVVQSAYAKKVKEEENK